MRIAYFLILVFSVCWGYSQREAANWYFGNNAGLDFNSGSPVPLLDGQLKTLEGCESFSDAQGNLLFYTDGKTVWNRFNAPMQNGDGLKGSFSTSQSALVIPNPAIANIYYVFTPDDVLAYGLGLGEETQSNDDGSNGFNFTTIDMFGDGGRGAVVSKNIELLASAGENVTAVRNFDDNYYWVVTHHRDRFYAYKVDENGVDTQPVVSDIGPNIGDYENFRGSIKISPDGTKLAAAHTTIEPTNTSNLYLYDFDSTTGIVSNPLSLASQRVYYGVEFSANSSKLYASGLLITSTNDTGALELVQFDLDSPDIRGSEYLIHSFQEDRLGIISGALQLAIDKKIYHAIPNENLSVIRTPNLAGINSDFRPFGVDLGNRTSSYGLPPFVQSFFETIVTIENFCEGDATSFTTESSSNVSSIVWNFGDPASGSQNTAIGVNPSHVFTAPGVYTVEMEVTYQTGATRTFTEFVEIAEIPQVNTQIALVQCDADGIDDGTADFNLNEAISLFNNGNEDISALFFETLADAQANTNQLEPLGYRNLQNGQLIYARAFENAECFSIVEIILSVKPMSDLGLFDTIAVCIVNSGGFFTEVDTNSAYDLLGEEFGSAPVQLFKTLDDAILETDRIESESVRFDIQEIPVFYFRVEQNSGCDFIGRLDLELIEPAEFEEFQNISLCNSEATLIPPEGFDTYVWSTGAITKDLVVTEIGDYEVTFGSGTCSYTQFFTVGQRPQIELDAIIVNDFQQNNSVTIQVRGELLEDLRFSLDGGSSYQASNTFFNVLPGVYTAIVSNGCTERTETIVVGGVVPFFTPNNDGFNDRWTLDNAELFPGFRMSVFDRYGRLLATFDGTQPGWDGTFQNIEMPSADYWFRLQLAKGREVTGHFTLKR